MATLTEPLARVKHHLADVLPERLIRSVCRDLGHSWRERQLGPTVTTYLLLQQALHGNVAVGELRHLCGLDFTDSAYCQARARLPLGVLRCLQRAVAGRRREDLDDDASTRWKGHRVYLIDGTGFSMPDTPELCAAFGQPGGQAPGCGFPVAHLLVRLDAHAGYLLQSVVAPLRTHDLAGVQALHRELRAGDVLVGDRAFCSFAHLALLRQQHSHGLFRVHQKQRVDFRPGRRHATAEMSAAQAKGLPRSRWLKRLGRRDQLVEYVKPKKRPDWLSDAEYAALPETLVVRELRFKVRIPGRRTHEVTVVTTLVNARRVLGPSVGQAIWPAVAGGSRSEAGEDHLAAGRAAVSITAGGDEGVAGALDHLQSGAAGDAASGQAAACGTRADQLRGRVAMAAASAAGAGGAAANGESGEARSGRAAGAQASAQAIPGDAEAPCPAPPSPAATKPCGLTEWHSAMSPYSWRIWSWSTSRRRPSGAGGALADDVDESACAADSVPLLRRNSGGGTALDGPRQPELLCWCWTWTVCAGTAAHRHLLSLDPRKT